MTTGIDPVVLIKQRDALVVLDRPSNNLVDIQKVCAKTIGYDINTNMVTIQIFETPTGGILKSLISVSELRDISIHAFSISTHSDSEYNFYIKVGPYEL